MCWEYADLDFFLRHRSHAQRQLFCLYSCVVGTQYICNPLIRTCPHKRALMLKAVWRLVHLSGETCWLCLMQ